MTGQVRYQVFVSSTYEDLHEERQQATQAILEAECFPSGMELFPASDDTQWELIKRVIAECDYYIVIVSGRYGSLSPNGLSYTEMEYDYAIEIGAPVLGFVNSNLGAIPFQKVEQSEDGRRKLTHFREKVMSRSCRKYTTAAELGMAVLKSLMSEARVRPRVGWVRSSQARSDEDIKRERKLTDELEEANQLISRLERKIRDIAVLRDEIPIALLSQGNEVFDLIVTFTGSNKIHVREIVALTWDEIFRVIGPSMYGYIVGKSNSAYYGRRESYSFQDNLEEHVRGKILDRIQGRKINIEPSQIDTIVFQFKELGLLMFDEKTAEEGEVYRGITLTPLGEQRLTRISVSQRT